MAIRRVEAPPRRDYYTNSTDPPLMRCPPIKAGSLCSSPADQKPCREEAVGWLFRPDGTPIPGCFVCLRHGKAAVDQHHHHGGLDFHLVFARGARLLAQRPQCDEHVKLDTGMRQCEREKDHEGAHRAGKRLWRS